MKNIKNFVLEYNPFNLFLQYIFSKNSIVQGSVVLMIARTIETHRLFMSVYPDTLIGNEREIASWAMAIGIEWAILMVTSHIKHTSKLNPIIYAVSSGILTLFFLGVFKESDVKEYGTLGYYLTIGYLSVISGYSLYTSCELLVTKAKSETIDEDLRSSNNTLQLRLDLTSSQASEYKEELDKLSKLVSEMSVQLTDTTVLNEMYKQELTICKEKMQRGQKRPITLFEYINKDKTKTA